MTTDNGYHGLLLIDKPPGISSHDAVMKVRQATHRNGIGHCGTLDPIADGLLVMCLGRAAKIMRFLTDLDKTYRAVVHLGVTSPTYDAEGVGPESTRREVPQLTDDDITDVLRSFHGKIEQRVPAYSAVRVNGRRLYEMARRGEQVEQPVREIEISKIRLLSYRRPRLEIEVTCSKGTYVRSLANDMGDRLGCGGYLASLSRISIGPFRLEDALTLDAVAALHEDRSLGQRVLPIETALPYAAVWVTDEFSLLVIQGRSLRGDDIVSIEGRFDAGDNIVLKDRQGVILAVGTAGIDSTSFRSHRDKRLFNYLRVLN